jgi:hypothetical protein
MSSPNKKTEYVNLLPKFDTNANAAKIKKTMIAMVGTFTLNNIKIQSLTHVKIKNQLNLQTMIYIIHLQPTTKLDRTRYINLTKNG